MTRFLLSLLFVCAQACAQGSVQPVPDGGTNGGSDTGGSNVTPGDSGPSNNDTNNGEQDTGDPCGMCCPGERTCLDGRNLGVCKEDGSGYDSMPCNEDTVCENGTCITAPVCSPGEKDCFDSVTVLTCRQTGEGWIQMTCDDGFSCSQGECTDKTPLSGGCAADDECATGNCRCGADTDDGCPDVGGGICTNMECDVDSCGMNAHCLDSAQAPLGAADYDHCVLDCSPEDVACPTGSTCVSIPAKTVDGWDWRQGCYFQNVSSFGDDCSSEADCLAGECLLDYFDTGLCTRTCESNADCPSNSACVELRTDEFWCALFCGDGSVTGTESCPLDEPEERFDVTCKTKADVDGGVHRVCATP